jgi:hypothetical protein
MWTLLRKRRRRQRSPWSRNCKSVTGIFLKQFHLDKILPGTELINFDCRTIESPGGEGRTGGQQIQFDQENEDHRVSI